ncbi:hypothetical protein [Fodinicola feengrottensis]
MTHRDAGTAVAVLIEHIRHTTRVLLRNQDEPAAGDGSATA